MGLFADLQERVGSLWDDDDDGGESGSRDRSGDRSGDRNRTREHDRERPREHSAEPTRDAAPAAPGAGRTQEEHEEEDEGGGGLLGMVSSAIRNPRQAAAGAARAMTTAAASSVLGPVVAPALGEMAAAGVEAVADLASEGGSRLAHGAAEMGGAALRGVGAEETAAMVERAPARIAQAAGDLQEGAAQYVDRDVRQALVGNGEDGEGLIGSFAEGVEAGSHVAGTGLGQVRAIASDPGVARVLETVSMGALTGEEINEEVDDIARGLSDFVDEDIRDMVAGEQRHAPENPELRLEDPAAQRDVERRARILFNATDGAGTDPEQITEAMRGASPDAIAAMEALMWREHGIDMRRTLDRELSGSSEDEILGTEDGPGGMISGDPVEQALSEIGGATHGMITESDRIEAAIRSVPADRRAEVIERMGGEDAAEATLRRETRGQDPAGTDGQVATALLENRDADAIALRLDESLNRGTGEMLGHAIGIDDQDISDLDRQVHRWVGDRVGDLMGADEAARERARREMGDHTPYFAALNDLFGNQDEVAAQLENIPADQRQAVERSFARITRGSSETLEANLEHEMEAGPERDRAVALLHGDRAAADAAALQLAADQPLLTSSGFVEQLFLGPIAMTENVMNGGRPDINATDTEGFMQVLQRREGESDDQYQERRGEMEHILRERYGSDLDELMSDELGEGSLDHQRARDLSDDGELDWRFQLRYAAEREIGTDEDMYLAGLRRAAADPTLTDEERAELREEAFENPLSELDGRPALEAQEILEGPPADDAEQVDRWLRRHEFDRDTLGRALVDVHSQSGTDYDRHMRELQAIRGRMEDGHVRDEDRARFEELGRILEGDQASYRTRQDETAEVAAEAAAVTAATVATIASAGSLSPVAAAALAATVGGTAGMAMRGTVLGDAYEREDIGADALRTAASAAGGASSQALQALGPTNLVTRALTQAPSAMLTHGTDLALTEEDLTWGHVGRHMAQGGAEILGTGLGETVEDHLGERLGDGLGGRVIANATGGLVENTTSSALDSETWQDGVGQGLARIAGRGTQGAIQSGAMAAVEHGHAERQQQERAAAQRALEGSEPRPHAPDSPHAGDEFRAEFPLVVDPHAARAAAADTSDSLINEIHGGGPSPHVVDPEAARAASADTSDSLIDEIHSPAPLITDPRAARAAAADTSDSLLDDIHAEHQSAPAPLVTDQAAARAADADTADSLIDEIHSPAPLVVHPEAARAAAADTSDSLIDEINTSPPVIVDANAARAADADTTDALLREIHSPPPLVVDPAAAQAAADDTSGSEIYRVRNELQRMEAENDPAVLVTDPAAASAADADTADRLIDEIHSPAPLVIDREAAEAASADTSDDLVREIHSPEPLVVDREAAEAASADTSDDLVREIHSPDPLVIDREAAEGASADTADSLIGQIQHERNGQIRQWYNDQLASLPEQDAEWAAQGLSAEERARRASAIRHDARVAAREMMHDPAQVTELRERDMREYQNPDGPTFEQLVDKYVARGMTRQEAYEAIIGSSQRSNEGYNRRFGAQRRRRDE